MNYSKNQSLPLYMKSDIKEIQPVSAGKYELHIDWVAHETFGFTLSKSVLLSDVIKNLPDNLHSKPMRKEIGYLIISYVPTENSWQFLFAAPEILFTDADGLNAIQNAAIEVGAAPKAPYFARVYDKKGARCYEGRPWVIS